MIHGEIRRLKEYPSGVLVYQRLGWAKKEHLPLFVVFLGNEQIAEFRRRKQAFNWASAYQGRATT